MTSASLSPAELLLTLAEPGPSPAGGRSRRLRSGQLTVGRAVPADWVLDDPHRLLSKSHCRFESLGGRFVVTDTSTNGLFVNGSEIAIGNGNSVELASGDVLSLGDYALRVTIAADRAATGPTSSLDVLVEGDEWLPPRDETGTSGIGPGEPVDSSWLRAPAGDQRPPQSEFFQPPPVQKGGIPDDWFLDGTAPGPADPPRPMPSVSPPPQAASLSSRLPGAMSAEVAVDELRGHVTALHAAVTAVLDWLPPDLAAEAARLFQTTYGATRFR